MKSKLFKIFFLIIIIVAIQSCNSVKRLSYNENLLTKNTVIVNDKVDKTEGIKNLIYQKPNTNLLGYPLRLHLYNLARPNIDSIVASNLEKNPKRKKRLERFLSKKQYNEYIKFRINFNKWLKKTGEAPAVFNDTLSKKSIKRLKEYYYNNGWFDVEASYDSVNKKAKKVTVNYIVKTGKPYLFDNIKTKITSPIIDSLYQSIKAESYLKTNQQYKTESILAEKDRITSGMRNSGVYHFNQDYFYFEIDTIGQTKKANIELLINDRAIRQQDTVIRKPFNIYKIKDVNIYTNGSFKNRNKQITDSISYNGYNLYSVGKTRYKPKALTNAIFITPNKVFKDINRTRTYRKISDLRTFKYPNIEYIENPDTTLTTNIYLTPIKKFRFDFSAEASQSNIQSVGLSFNPSLLIRNIFKGAETLEISGVGSIGASKDVANDRDQFFDINEIGANFRLTIPRLFSPFNTEKIIPKYMFPSTRISLATTSQTNIGLDKQTFTGIFNYKWFPSKKVTNRLDLFNIIYVRNLNTANYFGIYGNSFNNLNDIAIRSNYIENDGILRDPGLPNPFNPANVFIRDVLNGTANTSPDDFVTVNAINERKERLTEDNLIFSSSFNYSKDTRANLLDETFSVFRLKVESAGNILSAASNLLGLETNSEEKQEVLNVVYSQYLKTELDFIKHWDFGNKNILALRSFFGIAIPYGNSNNIPFAKSFFAGGANDNRAWTPYNLGPGSLETTNEFNEANLKIAFSAEQRANLFGPLNGALFIDLGNIWNVLDDVEDDAATFTSLESLKDIAIGSGFGLRYDFNFFVLRGDIGFKTYDPSFTEGNRWFKDYNFKNAVYNIGINYPF